MGSGELGGRVSPRDMLIWVEEGAPEGTAQVMEDRGDYCPTSSSFLQKGN